jgi:hypothetical protein
MTADVNCHHHINTDNKKKHTQSHTNAEWWVGVCSGVMPGFTFKCTRYCDRIHIAEKSESTALCGLLRGGFGMQRLRITQERSENMHMEVPSTHIQCTHTHTNILKSKSKNTTHACQQRQDMTPFAAYLGHKFRAKITATDADGDNVRQQLTSGATKFTTGVARNPNHTHSLLHTENWLHLSMSGHETPQHVYFRLWKAQNVRAHTVAKGLDLFLHLEHIGNDILAIDLHMQSPRAHSKTQRSQGQSA